LYAHEYDIEKGYGASTEGGVLELRKGVYGSITNVSDKGE
jgi:hypothetical protein